MLKRIAPLVLGASMVLAGAIPAAHAQRVEIYQSGKAQLGADLALEGHDAVAYQTDKAPVAGKSEFRVSWKGAEWRFASKANLDTFVGSPEKYAPQFGGYCAFAVAHGSTAPGDPKVWDVVNGKLYLNVSKSVQSTWQKDQSTLIPRAEKNWPGVLK